MTHGEQPPGGPELLDLSALLTQPGDLEKQAEQQTKEPTSHLHTAQSEVVRESEVVHEIAEFARNSTIGHPEIAPRIPFTLRVSGILEPHHRARLLAIIKEAGLGISEMDLEPQLESGQLLLTRMSEYTGVQIVQALRDASVRMSLTPDAEDPDLLPST